ncbi:MAG: cation:dicarboxylase symporter family transporter [Treponema sp.]|nr:cation:dicarboxylase symporter family transporter [Treponema sp.]
MKIWLKLFLGSLLGVIAGILLPYNNQNVLDALAWLERLAIGIGRYALVPMLFFSLTVAVYELRQDGQFWRLAFHSFILIIGCAVFVITAGILVTLIFPPSRIPILIEEQMQMVSLNTADNFIDLFPSNMFSALAGDGVYMMPVYVFAFFLGMGLSYDRNYTKPVISMVDSLSRIFYYIASFFSEILAIVMIALSAYWAVRFHNVMRADIFGNIIALFGIFTAVFAFGILPLFLYFIKPKCNPWVVLYGSLGQAIAAFFSGDINFTLPVIFRHLKENLGIRRRSSTVTMTFFTIFGRAGSAMIAAAAFIVIIQSYVSLEITALDVFIIGAQAFLISFLLARCPGNGAYMALAALCAAYGKGYESGYLILKPIAFYLISLGTFLDIMIATFASHAIARLNGFQEDKRIDHFI